VNYKLVEFFNIKCGYRGGPSCTAGAINKGEKVISAADQATSITSGTVRNYGIINQKLNYIPK
jgi:hypothetical protein